MFKKISIFLCLANVFASATCIAQPIVPNEDSCEKSLRMKIEALEVREKITGQTLKLAGYSIAEIHQLRILRGACQAAQEIDAKMDSESRKK